MRYTHLRSSIVVVLVVVCLLLTKYLFLVPFLQTLPLKPLKTGFHPEVFNKSKTHMDNNDTGSVAASFGFVYLGNEHHFGVQRGNFKRGSCPNVYASLQSLSLYFPMSNATKYNNKHNNNNNNNNNTHLYPEPVVIILHDDALSASTQEALQQASRFPIKFHSIVYAQHQDEKWANHSLINYERMCAFWFHYFFEIQSLPDYIMRLDTDTCITSEMRINPFHYMVENKMEYMYHSTFMEPSEVIVELKDFFLNHPGQPVNNHSILIPWWPSGPDDGVMEVFSTNLEWIYMPAFRRPHLLKWREEVWDNGGIFHHRWGDAPLRTNMVLTMFNSSHISQFCPFSYNHSYWDPFKSCHERTGIFVHLDGWNIVTQDF